MISFATVLFGTIKFWTCSERERGEKFKMKIYVSNGIRTHTTLVHDRKVSAFDRSATMV